MPQPTIIIFLCILSAGLRVSVTLPEHKIAFTAHRNYSDTGTHISEGNRRHARLFGYLRTNREGRFELATIKPQGYPQSNLPAHIYIEATTETGKSLVSERLLDDDLRLVGEHRNRSVNEGFAISKHTGTAGQPVYLYPV